MHVQFIHTSYAAKRQTNGGKNKRDSVMCGRNTMREQQTIAHIWMSCSHTSRCVIAQIEIQCVHDLNFLFCTFKNVPFSSCHSGCASIEHSCVVIHCRRLFKPLNELVSMNFLEWISFFLFLTNSMNKMHEMNETLFLIDTGN